MSNLGTIWANENEFVIKEIYLEGGELVIVAVNLHSIPEGNRYCSFFTIHSPDGKVFRRSPLALDFGPDHNTITVHLNVEDDTLDHL